MHIKIFASSFRFFEKIHQIVDFCPRHTHTHTLIICTTFVEILILIIIVII